MSASSSARARSKAKGCRAASWVPVRLAQGWQPFQHRAWLMRSILRGGFLQGSTRHLFFKPRNELTAKLTGPAAVAKLPRGRTAKQAEKRALRRARRVGTLRDSSHSRDSPATRLQVTTSRRAICARTNSSVSLHVFTFYGCKNPRSRRYGQTRSQSDSLATPLILHTRERGYFPRRPPDAANSFALCWARSAPHRQGAGKNLRSAPVLQAEDPQPRSRGPGITARLLAGTEPATRRAARPRRSRTPPAALPAGGSGEERGGRGRPAEPVLSPPRASPPGSAAARPTAQPRRRRRPPGASPARRRSRGGGRARAPRRARKHTDTRSDRPASRRRRPMPLSRQRPAAFPRRRPQSPPLSASCARHRPVPPPAPAARPGPAGGERPVPAVPPWGAAAPPRAPLSSGARPRPSPVVGAARRGTETRPSARPPAPCFSPSLARRTAGGCWLRSSLGEVCGEEGAVPRR